MTFTRDDLNRIAAEFEALTNAAAAASRLSAGRIAPPRAGWGTWIFTRMLTTAHSILALIPRPGQSSEDHGEHFDSTSVMSLCRNLIDAAILFHYVAMDKIGENEWQCRKWAIDLHDCISRKQLLKGLGITDQLSEARATTVDLRKRIKTNKYYQSLSKSTKDGILSGKYQLILPKDEIVRRMNVDAAHYNAMYGYFSAHSHSSPLAFHRMGSGQRGRGIETQFETGTMALALQYTYGFLRKAAQDLVALFPDIKSTLTPEDLSTIFRDNADDDTD